LIFVEGVAFLKRSDELKTKPIKIKNAEALLQIHGYLFQDVYEWTGEARTVEISKQGKQFFPRERFSEALSELLFDLISKGRKLR
jgi:cell filamentation protein